MSSIRDQVGDLLESGSSPTVIARKLGIARNTVTYHADRLREGSLHSPEPRPLLDQRHHVSQITTRERVAALLDEGLKKAEIARVLGLTKSAVSYHARRLGEPVDKRCARRYDWDAVQRFYDAGHSITECQQAFGFSRETWHAARQRGAVVSRPHGMPLADLLSQPRNRSHLKKRLIKLGVKEDRCEICGIDEWRGRPLSLALHHINGDGLDNRLENLQLLCPNCHSQTHNFSGRSGAGRAARAA